MEGMGVFELDFLDNIRSAQIWLHAKPLSCWQSHSYLLLCLLLTVGQLNSAEVWQTFELSSISLKLRALKEEFSKGDVPRLQTDSSESLFLFMAWRTLSVVLLSKMTNWRRVRSTSLFWFPQTSYLRAGLGGIQPQTYGQRGDNTLHLWVSISAQSRETRCGTGYCICCYGYCSMFYCDALVLDNN